MTPAEYAEWNKKVPYKQVPHAFKKKKNFQWGVCTGCGLLRMRNPFTQWAVEKGCYADEHPQYIQARRRFAQGPQSQMV